MARSSKRKSPSTLATSKKNKTFTANNTATVDCHNNNNNNENPSRKPASNFISQLQTLREFTQGCTQYNETDLSSCLRACGYNVQIAAEKLITGQYRDHNQRHHHHQDHQDQHQDQKSGKSILFQHASGSKEHNSSTTSAMKRQVSSSAKRASQTDTMTSKPIAISRSCEHHASGEIKLDTIKHDANGIGNGNESTIRDAGLLLCQRWVCGLSTSRKGSIEYNEPISIIPSTTSLINAKGKPKPKGVNTVRFKGTKQNIEGTLDTNISSFLSPFLSGCKDTEGNVHKPMIQIMAKALMEDDRIKIGMEVPLELNVYILRPKEFFQLFQSSADGGQGAGADYWSGKGKLGGISTLAKAAFDLLQWAHYSSLPTFESNCTAAVKEPGGSGDDGDDDDDGDGDGDDVEKHNGETEEENAPEWANDLYSNTTRTSTKGSEQTTQQQQQQQQQQLLEEKDPVMLNKKGVHLRCYQRQALNWMIHREEHANEKNSEDFKKQLELLSELSALQRASTGDDRDHGGHDTSTNSNVSGSGSGTSITDVKCAVGPVLVSNKIALQAKSLDGQEPSVHPLWQQRFLWDKDADADRNGNNVYSFYVNELLQTASKCSPNAPRECRGGILADAMGLGKTVMLLALIANDVERREDVSKQSPSDVGTGTDASSHTEIIEIESNEDSDDDDEWKPVPSTRSVSGKSNRGPITTLVVAPLSLLVQWEEEIQSKSSLSCLAYYGDQAKKLGESDLTGVDVLITTYGTLQSEYSSKLSAIGSSASTPLLSTCFRRVILDEAHIIKNPNTGASKACCEINAERRWCVTGTPISNSLQDIFGLIKFLKHEPWCVKAFWKKAIQTPKAIAKDQEGKKGRENKDAIDAEDIGAQSLERVRRVLQPLLLRRTKDTLAQDGTPILTLPPVETKIISVILSEEERHFYNVLLSKSQTVFEGFIQAGTASKSWFAIFALLQRLRQSCDHLALTVKARLDKELKENPKAFCNGALEEEDNSNQDEENDKFLKELLNAANKRSIINNRDDDGDDDDDYRGSQLYTQNVVQSLTQCIQNSETYSDECAICLEVPSTSDLAVTPCSHIFCRSCLRDSLDRKKRVSHSNHGECPICAEEVADDDIICTQADPAPRDTSSVRRFEQSASKENELNARDILESALKGKSSSKILAIVRELEFIWDEDPGTKVLIFSQYLGMFDLLQREFTKRRMTFLRLDGKMSLNDRRRTVKQFNSSSVTTLDENGKERGLVLLASMKACGVGLNLTAASSVFIVDPWWNHALESQCINRIHRIGQTAAKVRVRKFIVTDSVEEKIVKMQERKQGMASEVLSDKASAGKTGKPTLDDFKTIFGRSE
eukprot:scaffold74_cov277-Chaetoceros_neogracile.AAC.11